MIHTKELRFGNKVKTRKGEVITVQQILANSLIYDTQIKVHREAIVRGSYETDYFTHLDEEVKELDCHDVEAIPLTSEILRKSGFRNYIREQWILTINGSHLDFEFVDGGLKIRNPAPALATIQYVHQLQNFLYAISMHELNVQF